MTMTTLTTTMRMNFNHAHADRSGIASHSRESASNAVVRTRRELTLEKDTLSSQVRKKRSTYDDRTSSLALGSLGLVVMTSLLAFFVISDVVALMSYAKRSYYDIRVVGLKSPQKRSRTLHGRIG